VSEHDAGDRLDSRPFLTLPTRVLTGQQIMSAGSQQRLSWGTSAGCSPSHTGYVSASKPRHAVRRSLFTWYMVKLRIFGPPR
jgi:hypothetical protein